MTQKLKRALALGLTVCMLTTFAACSQPAPSTSTTNQVASTSQETQVSQEISFPLSEPFSMSMFAIANGVELPKNKAFQLLQEKTNIQWEVQSALPVDIIEKRNLLFASNNYPDVFYKSSMTQADVDKYASQGILIPLDDLIAKHAPNLTAIYEKNPELKESMKSPDGKIYSMPMITTYMPQFPSLFYNKAWAQALNVDSPKSAEELYTMLKAFATQDPNGNGIADEIPLSFYESQNTIAQALLMLPYFDVAIDHNTHLYVDGETLSYAPTSDEFKQVLLFLKRLYDEKLLDKNSFVQTMEQMQARGKEKPVQLGAFFDAGAYLTVGEEECVNYDILHPGNKTLPLRYQPTPGTFAITDACERPDLAMAWVDYLYSEEGSILSWMGVEGKSYKINDDGTFDFLVGDYPDVMTLRQNETLQGAAQIPTMQPELFSKISALAERIVNKSRQDALEFCAEPFPILRITEQDNKQLASILADIEPYVAQFIARIITGEIDIESSWDEYLATLENMGLSQAVEIYNNSRV